MDLKSFRCVIFLVLLTVLSVTVYPHRVVSEVPVRLSYSSAILKLLRPARNSVYVFEHELPPEMKPRKRGRKGGVRARVRRRSLKPFLPTIVTGNARSLKNKIDELSANVRFMHEYREASLICFSETWFTENIPDSSVDMNGFYLARNDRTKESNKGRAGGVCVDVNEKWCSRNNIHVKRQMCTPDIECLTVVVRPYYLPREFPKITVNIVYIPPDANVKVAADTLVESIHEQQSSCPDGLIYITGDFNKCSLTSTLPTFHQCVNVPTRGDKTIDLCYTNILNAYKCVALPPIGRSDHDMCLLLPKYKPKLKSSKPVKKVISIWNEENSESLRACFECTDWNVFKDSCDSVDELCETISGYISFCEDLHVQKKEVTCYPNNKPWVSKELKEILNEKKEAFKLNDRDKLKSANNKVKEKIRECKHVYKERLERQFACNNSKSTWQCLKTIVGDAPRRTNVSTPDTNPSDYVNKLNAFYARFDTHDFSDQLATIKETILSDHTDDDNRTDADDNRTDKGSDKEKKNFVVNESEVMTMFNSLKVQKASGPDGVKSRILKMCSSQLSPIYAYMFNMSLKESVIPTSWKCSEIIPVPKKQSVQNMNDVRPVALTSVLMKCLERLVLKELRKSTEDIQDAMQFAYRAKRGVEDAILMFLDNIYKHIDSPRNYCRILFADFSSAFNTIQPHIMVSKLINMNINKCVIAWIFEFLTNRPQYVKLNGVTSDLIFTNTGAPQGCVISPVLFTLYTNDCTFNERNTKLIKFADDSTLQGLITTTEDEYRDAVNVFTNWCDDHFLLLNVKKTKELIIDFRVKKDPLQPLFIKDEEVEVVDTYKYLGVTIDSKLDWHPHAAIVHKKLNQRMFFLRKLRSFDIDSKILSLFYHSMIEGVLLFCICCWAGNCREQDKGKFDRIIKKASKISGHDFCQMDELYKNTSIKKINTILKDPSHPLFTQIIRSRSGRYIPPRTNKERYKRSFLPSAIRLLK